MAHTPKHIRKFGRTIGEWTAAAASRQYKRRGFILDPVGELTAKERKAIRRACRQRHAGDFIELNSVSNRAVLGHPGAGMSFNLDAIMDGFKAQGGVESFVIDKGDSFKHFLLGSAYRRLTERARTEGKMVTLDESAAFPPKTGGAVQE